MIPKQEILSIARTTSLLPTTVEKDYVLSWVLYAVSKNTRLSEWMFKGGTCLKKCYFETYRFSEDLDFTVPKGAIYELVNIKEALTEIATFLYQETGIDIKVNTIEVEESKNKNNAKTFAAKFGYVGPLHNATRAMARIKFDITDDEVIADVPEMRAVFHSYSDAPVATVRVKCYSLNEILAEKTRAMYEREGRARDVYDVVNIGRNFREDVDRPKAHTCLREKFKFKGLPEPTVENIIARINPDLLKANWNDQLSHQLPVLPPVESFLNDLYSELSWWIDARDVGQPLHTIQGAGGEEVLPRAHFPTVQGVYARNLGIGRKVSSISGPAGWGANIDLIRYAARNRLYVTFDYKGVRRFVEPYSLRRPGTGNLLLYVYEARKGDGPGGGIKAFKINEISNVTITQEVFQPQYTIEL
jgi:predicted nucleotidyltransferase component of viral defense system